MSVFDSTGSESRRIFISYSSIDRVRTNSLSLLLEALGHSVFHDHRTIKPGMKWEAALQDGLAQADAMLVFWTRHASRSDWVRKEYEFFAAHHGDQPLVPILGDETPLSELLKTRQHADFVPVVNDTLALKRKMRQEGASVQQVEDAVVGKLEAAGIEVDKKLRWHLFVLLGFGWLLTLLRRPGAQANKVARAAVEKTAQASAGQVVALGALGLAGALVAYPAGRAAARQDLEAEVNRLNSRLAGGCVAPQEFAACGEAVARIEAVSRRLETLSGQAGAAPFTLRGRDREAPTGSGPPGGRTPGTDGGGEPPQGSVSPGRSAGAADSPQPDAADEDEPDESDDPAGSGLDPPGRDQFFGLAESARVRRRGREMRCTELADEADAEVEIKVQIYLDRRGRILRLEPTTPEDAWGLTQRTLDTLRTWRFAPATRDGEPVPSTFEWTERYRC